MRTLILSILALMALAIVSTAAAQEKDDASFRKAFIRIQRQKAFKAWREKHAPRLAQMTKEELREMRRQKLALRGRGQGTPSAFARSSDQAGFGADRQWAGGANRQGAKPSSVWSKAGRRAAQTKDRKTIDRSVERESGERPARQVNHPQGAVGSALLAAPEDRPAKERTAQAKSRDGVRRNTTSSKAERNNDASRQRADGRINQVIRSDEKVVKASTRKLMRTRQWSRRARESTTAKKAAMFRARHAARTAGQNDGNPARAPKANPTARPSNAKGTQMSAQDRAGAPRTPHTNEIETQPMAGNSPKGSPLAMPKGKAEEKQDEERVMSAASTLLSAPPQRDDDR